MSEDAIIDQILVDEGWPKYTNAVADRGGPTKGGVTLGTLSVYRKRPCTADDVMALTETEVRAIYRGLYITGPGFDRIKDSALRREVIDAGVLHGTTRACGWLQEAAGLTGNAVDGAFGKGTEAAVNRCPPAAVLIRFSVERIRFMGQIINNNAKGRRDGKVLPNRDQGLFAEGWLRRATESLLGLANQPAGEA